MSRALTVVLRAVRTAVLLAVVAGFVVGGVRLFAPPGPPTPGVAVDASEPPAEVAYDAMRTTEARSYAVRVVYHFEDGQRRTTRRVDPRGRQVYVVRDVGSEGWPAYVPRETYAEQQTAWDRDPDRSGPFAWTGGPGTYAPDGEYAHDEVVLEAGADVSVVAENRTTLVVRVNDTDAARELITGRADATELEYWRGRELRASYTLVIDRRAGVLRRSTYRQSALNGTGPDAVRTSFIAEKRYRDWGEVEVRRPFWLPRSFVDLFGDVLEGDR